MGAAEIVNQTGFLVDGEGRKLAVLVEYNAWKALLSMLED